MYGLDGIGLVRTKLSGRILEATADFMFVLLIVLIAKGYTVTRARLPQASALKMTVFACCYSIVYVTLFTYEDIHFDKGQVLYIYESIAGYGLIILRSVGWCMFIYSTFFTLKHYPEKGSFYYPFFSFYTLWFVAGPCIIIIANHIIAEWVREKVYAHRICNLKKVPFLKSLSITLNNVYAGCGFSGTFCGVLWAFRIFNADKTFGP